MLVTARLSSRFSFGKVTEVERYGLTVKLTLGDGRRIHVSSLYADELIAALQAAGVFVPLH